MKTLTRATLFMFVSIVAAVVGVVVWIAYEVGNRAIEAVDKIPYLFEAGALVTFFAFCLVVIGGAMALVRGMALRSRQIRPDSSTALYPQMYHGGQYLDLNADKAQVVAALSSGRRASAAVTQRVLDWQPELPQIAEAQRQLTARDVVDVDPREHPHWLLVGATGSGKTIASFAVLGELARRAQCQFVITEPGGVNWGAQTTATTTPQIAGAILEVAGEMERRQVLLRAQDVDHVQDLAQPLPYVVLVAEETESVLDDLRLTDRATRDATIIALRSIARMGRKCGICLVAVTQSGTTDVFDSHVRRNLTNVLLFRSSHTTGETWRVSQAVKLAELPTGSAWSVRHSACVAFPQVTRPALPQVQRLELLEPVLANGAIPVQNWPQFTAVLDGSSGSSMVLDGSEPVLAANEEPPAELAAQMRAWYADGVSKNAICRRTWPAKNGVTWSILTRILDGEL